MSAQENPKPPNNRNLAKGDAMSTKPLESNKTRVTRSGANSPAPSTTAQKSASTKDTNRGHGESQAAPKEPSKGGPSRQNTKEFDNNSVLPNHHQSAEGPPPPEKPSHSQKDTTGNTGNANISKPTTLRKPHKPNVAPPVVQTTNAKPSRMDSQSTVSTDSEYDLADLDSPIEDQRETMTITAIAPDMLNIEDSPPGRQGPLSESTASIKAGSRHTMTNTSSRPSSAEAPPLPLRPVNPKSRPHVPGEGEGPRHGPKVQAGSTSYAAVATGANTNAPSGPKIYLQQTQGRQNVEQHAGQEHPDPGDLPVDQMQVDFQEHVSGDRERGHNEGSGPTGGGGGGVFSAVSSALGLGGGRPPVPQFNSKFERDHYRLREDYKSLQDEYRRTERTLEKYAIELQKTQHQLKTWYNNARESQHETHRLHDQVQGLEHELMNVLKKYDDAKSLSDTRGKELVGAQVFLNKADSLSVSDLVQKVNGLNEEIFQAAASLGEALHFSKHDITEEDLQKRADYTCGLIGQPLVQLVHGEAQKPEGVANPLLVQITIQVCLTAFCAVKIQTWAAGERAIDHYLKTLYSEIRASTDQAVAGRWRALTRAQLRSNTDNWGSELEHDLRALLAVASWNAPTEQQGSFASKLPAIFRAVEDVKVSLSEKFTSADIEITSIHPKTAFIKTIMEESYGEDTGSENDVVIATTGLGLSKVVRSTEGPDIHFENVLMPKVVLESSLKAALEPAPPRTSRKKSAKRS
ncbi:hypothetical protein CPB83DRAFT_860290 [Crepidotus variabilis]|uniref:Uncharacterized protein n=1 Tax=Crepidotus variabilis TaxID=179855 RepID=A0A9P6JLK7_9AGAR|nr:hypothetical protein CPB83DRAFT_860290 [Crepidotus variabilis]